MLYVTFQIPPDVLTKALKQANPYQRGLLDGTFPWPKRGGPNATAAAVLRGDIRKLGLILVEFAIGPRLVYVDPTLDADEGPLVDRLAAVGDPDVDLARWFIPVGIIPDELRTVYGVYREAVP